MGRLFVVSVLGADKVKKFHCVLWCGVFYLSLFRLIDT